MVDVMMDEKILRKYLEKSIVALCRCGMTVEAHTSIYGETTIFSIWDNGVIKGWFFCEGCKEKESS